MINGIILWAIVFAGSLFFVIKGADWFTKGAEMLALRLGVSKWVIGLTLVAIGTSIPELFTSLMAALQGQTEIAAANVVGSNIANILLIIGLSTIVAKRVIIERDLIDIDLPFFAATTAMLIAVLWGGTVSRVEGLLCVVALGVYLFYAASLRREEFAKKDIEKDGSWKIALLVLGGLALLIVSSKYTVDALIKLGELLNIYPGLISITALSIGTSLPELMVSLVAAKRGSFDLSISNIIGSNIFNSVGVIGIVALVTPISAGPTVLAAGIGFLIAASALFIISCLSKKIHIWEGLLFVLLYVLFIAKLFNLF